MGYVYLIQPEEYIGTNILKIGMSTKNNCERIYKGYGKSHKLILVRHTTDPISVEKNIKKIFNEKFILEKGYEYFQGDVNDMEKTFFQIISTIESDDNFEEDDKFDEEECIKEHLLYINTFIDPHNDENIYKPKYFLDFDDKNPSLEIKIKIPTIYPDDGFYIEVKNGYHYYIHDRYTVFVFRDLIKKKILKLNKSYDIFDKEFLKMFDMYRKNIDDEILDICYDTLFELRKYDSYFNKSNDLLFLCYKKKMEKENEEFNEKTYSLKEKYEKMKQIYSTFEVNSVGPKYNREQINRYNFMRYIIKEVEESLKYTDFKIKKINESMNYLEEGLLKVARINYIIHKVDKKIYDVINIIHDTFIFIKVNKKYSITTLETLTSYKDEEIRFYLPYIRINEQFMEKIFDIFIDYKL